MEVEKGGRMAYAVMARDFKAGKMCNVRVLLGPFPTEKGAAAARKRYCLAVRGWACYQRQVATWIEEVGPMTSA